ncbi:Deoxyribose specific mutarotase [Escherichia coli]|nr:Deoxyribose specific mutarotase [Escherichia coli]
MSTRINLWRALFGEKPRILLENSDFYCHVFSI